MPNGRMKLKIKKFFLLNIATALFLLISFSVNALTMREKIQQDLSKIGLNNKIILETEDLYIEYFESDFRILDEEVKGRKILDVGAGTGKVTKYLNEKGLQLTSIDLNKRLIKKAAEKGILVLNENMLNIDKFPNFDTIINIGNALPHLNSKKEIYEFLEKSYNQLNDDGKIIIQIINFVKL